MNTEAIIAELCRGPLFPRPSFDMIEAKLREMCSSALRPSRPVDRNETAAVAFDKPRTTALCFDRVWSAFNSVPDDIAFGGDTEFEKILFITSFLLEAIEGTLGLVAIEPNFERSPFKEFKTFEKKCLDMIRAAGFVDFSYKNPDVFPNINNLTRFLSNYFLDNRAIPATPVYSGPGVIESAYRQGDGRVVVTTLSNLSIVDEDRLQWSQVREFRRDKEARRKYRRLLRWLDSNMIGKPAPYVEDEIATRLEDYHWSIRKHGLRTVTGAVSSLLESKFLTAGSAATAAAALVSEPIRGLLSGAGLIISKVAIRLADAAIDLQEIKRGPNSEVAFIYDVGKSINKKAKWSP